MHFDNMDLFFCFIGLAFVVYGIYGMYKQRITTKGKFGPARTHSGRDAVKQGAFFVVFGLLFVAFCTVDLLEKAYQ